MLKPQAILYPNACILCDRLLPEGEFLCESCRKDAPYFKNSKRKLPFLDSYTAVWYYKDYARDSILRYKFGRRTDLAPAYGAYLAARIRRDYPEGFDLLTWVPVSPLRRLQRGYDQCQLLAKALGKELSMRPRRLLFKFRHNPAQSGISDPALRRGNVAGVYRVLHKSEIPGKRILLIDDILTTGATAGECARVLKTYGAAEVHCAVLASAHKD